MAYFPTLPTTQTSALMTDAFLGINKDLSIGEGEFADMTNMTADEYPVLSTRKRRTYVPWRNDSSELTNPQGLIGTEQLVVIDDGVVYIDGEAVNGLTLSTDPSMQPKHTVCMGAYVCIWPDKKYVNLANPDDHGDMGATWSAATGNVTSAMMCRKDGRNYDMDSITISGTAPASPDDQQLWLDTSGDNDVLKQYSAIYNEWIQVATTYIKIQSTGIGKKFKEGDVVFLSGAGVDVTGSTEVVPPTSETLKFTTGNVTLKSSFTTSEDANGNIVNSSPTRAERTKTITVSGIPTGATVKSAVLTFSVSEPAHGYQVLTVNGMNAKLGSNSLSISGVKGNGEVSLKFLFYVWAHGTNIGTNSGAVTFSNITLSVTYETSGSSTEVSAETITAISDLNTSCHIYGAGSNYIIVAGLIRENVTLKSGLKAELKIPDLDYVCEANNRLWGCSYSSIDGVMVNEIRACALGDFRNWYLFEGTSMDSYTVSLGSDGIFTGAYNLKGNPLFFKENALHKISGTQPSNFTLNTIMCRGVQDGCWRSLAQVNEVLYYKARTDVMAYDGTIPRSISEKLGTARYYEASAGAFRDKYYICMHDESINWGMYVYDTQMGLWHKEDTAIARHFAPVSGSLYFVDERTPAKLVSVERVSGSLEDAFGWSVTFGTYGYQIETQKYLSRFNIRAQMQAGSKMKMEIMYDSDGEWVDEGTIRFPTLRTMMIPVIPRRCDHCQIRLSGNGDAKIYSVARILDVGGDG